MIALQPEFDASKPVQLGSPCGFAVDPENGTAWRAFVHFQHILYPEPLIDWTQQRRLNFLPEAPGHYSLIFHWKSADGRSGNITVSFRVVAARRSVPQVPTQVRVNWGNKLWAPGKWDAFHLKKYEQNTFKALRANLRNGQVAYDVGANLGATALQMLDAVGKRGHVYCIELNPVCVQFLLTNVAKASSDNCTILPVALGDREAEVRATINYGNTHLGLTDSSDAFESKVGHTISVHATRLDTLIENFGLRAPGFIKIDVEGAEAFVLQGMTQTLARHRPTLLIELHGDDAATSTLAQLDALNYEIEDVDTARRARSCATFLTEPMTRPIQVLCRPL